ncbi:glycosyl transferase family protein [Salinisphaera hydrothermalis C41B8]|uniref:Glycosyl transferase family protein n=1 Tax=Salinisphaera hydrothermalis (strain C41B8) TaxID=1304275 RepID=A0A084IMD9_SALHC|nr:glycosyl transferase family protein [Salinisphaera hydrothermalis C41B8]
MDSGSQTQPIADRCDASNTHSTRHPTISVIVAAYNIAGFIDACLASILASRSLAFEVIVVDDGSTDDTNEKANAFTADPRLRIVQRPNGGLGAARNSGIEAAHGRYIMFVDGDDWLEPDAVDSCLGAIENSPQADLLVFDYIDVRPHSTRRRICRPDFWGTKNAAWNKVYARALIGEHRFDTDIIYEDLAAVRPWVARARHPIHIDKALYHYRNTRSGSIMNSRDISRFFELFTAAERCVERIEADGSNTALGSDWKRRFYTSDVFVPGVIYWSIEIDDRATRHDYIARFMDTLPPLDLPSTRLLTRDFGPKIALIGECYKRRAYRLADFLLSDLGHYKRRVAHRLGIDSSPRGKA